MKIIFIIGAIVLAIAGIVLTYQMARPMQKTNSITAVASIAPYGYLAREIGGNEVMVKVLVPPGAEAHDYEPTPKEIVLLENADVVIANGAGIEPWLADIRKERTAKGKETLVMIEYVSQPITSKEGTDPHIWLNPAYMAQFARIIGKSLNRKAAAETLAQHLDALAQQYTEGLSHCTLPEAIVAHNAFSYLARAYHIILTPIAGISPSEEPSAQQIARLIDLARSRKVAAVYFEPTAGSKLSQVVAQEAGVMSLPLNPIETGVDYIVLMKENLLQLQKGLQCQ